MKIGIDFDRVLFKTDEFNEYLKNQTGLRHVEEDVHDDEGCYSPRKHAEASGIDVKNIYAEMEDLGRFLYPDVDELRKLRPEHEMVIVTRGEEKFQKKKVKASGAHRLFDQLYIVQKAPKNVGNIDFLIDDRQEEIERAGLPGMVFDREKHTMEDILKRVKDK